MQGIGCRALGLRMMMYVRAERMDDDVRAVTSKVVAESVRTKREAADAWEAEGAEKKCV